jgi:trk system potassium uptake protein
MKIRLNIFKKLTPELSLALSFFLLILMGAFLLVLPISTKNQSITFIDAFFTATSATCVTGLAVVDTGTHWSTFGQIVILALIQIGGLGIMTFSSFIVYIIARKLSLWDQGMLEYTFSGNSRKNLGQLLWTIILGTFAIEIVGAIILSVRFLPNNELGHAIYLGIFHSISAFCNAGFSLFSNSLVDYRGDLIVNFTIMALIILGGLGFWVIYDLRNIIKHKRNFHSTSLHTRIVLGVSAVLILFGFIIFLAAEWKGSMALFSLKEKMLASLFQSVSARTAGFNTLDVALLTNGSLFVLLLLMFIGASPGSCGGGIKTTTFALILAMIKSRMRNQEQVQISNRGIAETTISKAIGITFAAIVVLGVIIILLLIVESPLHAQMHQRTLLIDLIFEAFSAFGTVGLSTGVTPLLSSTSKFLLILLMYIGRIGPATLTIALAGIHSRNMKFAEDNVWVG